MIRIICYKIVRWLVCKQVIGAEDQELYFYAMKVSLLTSLPIIMILMISLMLGVIIEGMCMIISFMFIRKFCGGYHAKRFIVCFFSSLLIFALGLYIIQYIEINNYFIFLIVVSAIQLSVLSPIESQEKILDVYEKRKYKIITQRIVLVTIVMYVALDVCDFDKYAIAIALGVILSAGLQIPCVMKQTKYKMPKE